MPNKTVKKKLPLYTVILGLAVATFVASWARIFPSRLVESAYSRAIFPTISHILGVVSDAVPFSLLDVSIMVLVAILIYSVWRRRWKFLVGTVSFLYLCFFWGWGLNYHRPAVERRLGLEAAALSDADLDRFAETAAGEINRLWAAASKAPLERAMAADLAAKRVERVVLKIDGTDWRAASHVKRSVIADPWFRIAGVDGMFNPFGHEPLVIGGALPFELPFLMAHEIAHVRGVANEGEANLVALLATLASDDPRFRYSGWLYLWGYLKHPPQAKLDTGPQADLAAVRNRIQSNEIPLVNDLQTAILDAHLKANAVPAGIRSYSEFVALAVASQKRWAEFRN